MNAQLRKLWTKDTRRQKRLIVLNADFPNNSDGKECACNTADLGSIPGSGNIPWRIEWQPTPSIVTWKIPQPLAVQKEMC